MKSSYTVGGNINWYSYGEKQYGSSLKKKEKPKNRATIWSSNPILGTYPEKTVIQKDTCAPMFTAALFTIVNT